MRLEFDESESRRPDERQVRPAGRSRSSSRGIARDDGQRGRARDAGLEVEDQRYRAVVDEVDLHPSAEDPRLDVDALGP